MKSSIETVLVTGAGAGIGREFVRLFLARGARVVAVSLLQDELDLLQQDFDPAGRSLSTLAMDLSGVDAAPALHAWCSARTLTIDVLVNNAGFACFGEHVEIDQTKVATMLALNCATLTRMCALFGQDMRKRGRGRILNVGSMAGVLPSRRLAAYGGSKAYVNHFSFALRAELAPHGVAVTCLTPGMVQTKFADAAGISAYSGVSLLKSTYAKRKAASPAKVAEAGVRGLYAGEAQVVTGKGARLSALVSRIIPPHVFPWLLERT